MNRKLLQSYLLQLCLCVVACAYTALTLGAEHDDAALKAALKGRWEGTLTGPFRSQELSWHFELEADGGLKGYVGPSSAGMPRMPMDALVLAGGQLSFELPSQHAAFAGTVSAEGIAGNWLQDGALALRMRRKHFEFPLSDSLRAALLGNWELLEHRAPILLEFRQGEGRGLAGFLSMPAENLHEVPLVDIFVTEEGHAQFATDEGRKFSGRLVNGVLQGEYVANERRYRRNFVRAGEQEREYDLALSDAELQRMAGRWHGEVRRDDTVLEITTTADKGTRGVLVFDEGPLRSDPLLELQVEGDKVSFTSFNGRTFTGNFTEEGIAGEYRVNGRQYGVMFTRESL